MAEDGGDQQQEPVLFYARALYSYQPEEETEIGFEEAGIKYSPFLLFLRSFLMKKMRRGCFCD